MNSSRLNIGDIATPREEALTLPGAGAGNHGVSIPRGEALLVTGRDPAGRLEVEYQGRRWFVEQQHLQSWHASLGAPAAGPRSVAAGPLQHDSPRLHAVGGGSHADDVVGLSAPPDPPRQPESEATRPRPVAAPISTPRRTRGLTSRLPTNRVLLIPLLAFGFLLVGMAALAVGILASWLLPSAGDTPNQVAAPGSPLARTPTPQSTAAAVATVASPTGTVAATRTPPPSPAAGAALPPAPSPSPSAAPTPSPTPSPSPSPTPPPSPSPTPRASPTPAPPVIAVLQVCDGTLDCGGDEPSATRSGVTVCVRATAGDDRRPLVLTVTARDEAPTAADAPSVIARSEAVEATGGFTCHRAAAISGRLPDGAYRVWAFVGTTPLATTPFTLGPSR